MWYFAVVLFGAAFSLILFASTLPETFNELGLGRLVRFIIAMILLIFMLISAIIGFDSEYKRGQIDVIQGNIKYEIKVDQDTTWVNVE